MAQLPKPKGRRATQPKPRIPKQTLLGKLTGERGKTQDKGRKCPGNQVWDQKLKKCTTRDKTPYEQKQRQRYWSKRGLKVDMKGEATPENY